MARPVALVIEVFEEFRCIVWQGDTWQASGWQDEEATSKEDAPGYGVARVPGKEASDMERRDCEDMMFIRIRRREQLHQHMKSSVSIW